MNPESRVGDKIASGAMIAVWLLFIISSAFIIPITVRGYYFLHCHILDIPGLSGFSMDEIRLAFNDIMDFLWFGAPFKVGNMTYSEEGKAHFADCIPLFRLDLIIFIATSVLLVTYFVLIKTKVLRPHRFLGIGSWGYAGMAALTLFFVIGLWGLIDFYSLFVAFHTLFFPGKDNWVFDERVDQVIKILPESFFACCASFIGGVMALESIGGVVYSFVSKAKRKKRLRQ